MKKEKETKERKLSKTEIKRKEEFEALAEKLAEDGYQQKLLGISDFEMNSKIYLAAIPIILPIIILYFILGNEWQTDTIGILIAVVCFFVMVPVHEALHGITWSLFAKDKWKSISFGIIMESFTPYCNCKEPLKKYQIITGSLMPVLLLGVGFGIGAIVTGSTLLLLTAIFNIIGCGGDLLVVSKLLSYKSEAADILFIDHPYEIGTAVFEK